ncbi:hypothetical protein EVAR_30378_1 [Eumeta japonica]|uniref:Uncharacterized protein n=1 Tax=Eumeta variegata TaxID=151549 RepID=A0A4C1W6T6_EUMVA|nr:hypothetical protein EVAR_30378_1 [Eumeta japonica]
MVRHNATLRTGGNGDDPLIFTDRPSIVFRSPSVPVKAAGRGSGRETPSPCGILKFNFAHFSPSKGPGKKKTTAK